MSLYNDLTTVRLLKCPLTSDYRHTFYFSSYDEQLAHFAGLPYEEFSDFSYQRKDGYIRIPLHYDEAIKYNYVMYLTPRMRNSNGTVKWIFAFITDLKYIDEGRTDVYIKTDCLQTWMFNYQVNESFIEREHVSSDLIGEHTQPEELETGEYISNSYSYFEPLRSGHYYVIGATRNISSTTMEVVGGAEYNRVYSGIKYFTYESASAVTEVLKSVATAGKSDCIHSIFIVPKQFFSLQGTTSLSWNTTNTNNKIQRPTNLNGYVPKNNKMFTFPYTYLLVSNNAGSSAVYNYELFKRTDDSGQDTVFCDFSVHYSVTPSGSCIAVPKNYKGVYENFEEGLSGGKLPICSWNTDVYTNWLTQNSLNYAIRESQSKTKLAFAGVNAGVNAVSHAVSGNVAGVASDIVGGAESYVNHMYEMKTMLAEKYQHSFTSPQAQGNLNNGDVMFASGTLTFTAYQMSIKAEYAQLIDDFFSMFGYQVNKLSIPNKNHRERYWYTKTRCVNITGDIPQRDLQEIKSCYDNGVTFWKDAEHVGAYYRGTNNIVRH